MAEAYKIDFRKANAGDLVRCKDLGVVVSSWEPPAIGLVKINTDASIDFIQKRVRIGIVIRDSNEAVMASSSQIISTGYSPQIEEAVAVLSGIQFGLATGLWHYIFEIVT
ncbi:hypothetical protein Ddye_023316 [Dipteronia dyeriana]|uniref:RNase H type-1 domain-containing protein n=1 Tax=Dipteronia dyeriana TaxID=168575 RepID=A0AAD9WT50_9ROSI|nr:hypothetical protein Ddye_023316 [Dipteronia dyeriana]